MNIRACLLSTLAKKLLLWLVGIARIFATLYAIGNLGFVVATALTNRYATGFWVNHADLIEYWIRAAISILIVALFFPKSLAKALRKPGNSVGLGLALATSCVSLQIIVAFISGGEMSATWGLTQMQLLYTVGYAISAAISEEILCRFVILDRGEELIGVWAAFLCQTAIFVFIHISSLASGHHNFWFLTAGGLLLGVIYLRTRSLYASVTFHAAYNALVVPAFGGVFDGVQIYPWLSLDNFAKKWATITAIAFSVAAAVAVVSRLHLERNVLPKDNI